MSTTLSTPELSPPPTRPTMAWRPWAGTVLRVGLGVVAVYAAFTKISDLPASVRAVRAYELLPEGLAVLVGNGLPLVELILGVLLIGIALLVWGWQSGFLLLAALMGVVLEGSRVVSLRWQLTERDFRRLWDLPSQTPSG